MAENGSPHPQGAPRGLLHFYALLSIARTPMRGYDLMKDVEIKTEGAWHPGPGAVYPVLRKLAKQGYIEPRRGAGGPTQIVYEITPAGLQNIANAKRMMKSSTERWTLMRSLFIDLMEPDDLVRFALSSFELQIELVRTLVESDRTGLSKEDKLFVLRQYRLNLERELTRAVGSIKALEGRTRSESPAPRNMAGGRKKA
ncbi:MAG: PadR family transcriptional regulator [Nitrososphaerales archaeon]